MAMSLFGTQQRPKHLVEFHAGKCIRDGTTLKPDTRKGLIYMDKGDDELMHFYWKERKAGSAEDDFIIFPDDAEFVRVDECKTGRVYLLRFKQSNEKHLYWMQDKEDAKDKELVQRVNQLINDPEVAMEGVESTGDSAHNEIMQILGVDDVNVLQQVFQSAGGFGGAMPFSTPRHTEEPAIEQNNTALRAEESHTEATNEPSDPTWNEEQLSQLRNVLANTQAPVEQVDLELSDVLTTEALRPLLNDRELCSSLFPHLPEQSERSPEEVQQVVQSPQFRQALQILSFALRSGQLGPLMAQLGLDGSAGQDVASFLRAIEEQARRREQRR